MPDAMKPVSRCSALRRVLAALAVAVALSPTSACNLIFRPLGAIAHQIDQRPQPWFSVRSERRARVWLRTARGLELRSPLPALGAGAAAGGIVRTADLLRMPDGGAPGAGVLLDDGEGYVWRVVPLRRQVRIGPDDWQPKPPWFAGLITGEVVAGMPRWAVEALLGQPNQVGADRGLDRLELRYDLADQSVRYVRLDGGVVVGQRVWSPSASTNPR